MFFFKQKTAYEIWRDWSSDVCSSDLWAENQRALERVAELEERARRRDIRVDDETLFELYDARIPADVVSTRHFDKWWMHARHEQPDLLTLTPELLTNAAAAEQVRAEDYPDDVPLSQGLTLPLSYAFAPGTPTDGRSEERRGGKECRSRWP